MQGREGGDLEGGENPKARSGVSRQGLLLQRLNKDHKTTTKNETSSLPTPQSWRLEKGVVKEVTSHCLDSLGTVGRVGRGSVGWREGSRGPARVRGRGRGAQSSRVGREPAAGEGLAWSSAVPLSLAWMWLSGWLCAVGVGKEGYLSLSSGCSENGPRGDSSAAVSCCYRCGRSQY